MVLDGNSLDGLYDLQLLAGAFWIGRLKEPLLLNSLVFWSDLVERSQNFSLSRAGGHVTGIE